MGKKKPIPQKEMSEGQAIAITVLIIAAVAVALIFGAQFLIDYLFPNW